MFPIDTRKISPEDIMMLGMIPILKHLYLAISVPDAHTSQLRCGFTGLAVNALLRSRVQNPVRDVVHCVRILASEIRKTPHPPVFVCLILTSS